MSGKRSAATPCKDGKGTIFIGVLRADTGAPLHNASVKLSGPSPGSMKTDADGFVEFLNRTPGAYTFSVSPPKDHFQLVPHGTAATVAANGHVVREVQAYPTGTLKVELVDDLGKSVKQPVALAAGGASGQNGQTSGGSYSFAKIRAGTYQVDASAPSDLYENAQESQANVVVPEGGSVTARFVLRILNTVTPHLDAPKNEVIYEPLPPPPQPPAVAPPAPPNTEPPLHLRLHFTETRGEKPFRDNAVFALDRATVDLYTDAACTRRFALDGNNQTTIMNATLARGVDLYLRDRDRIAGPLIATLTLDTPANKSIRVLGTTTKALQIKALNVVLPKIRLDYETVLLERGLHQHQKNAKGVAEAELHQASATRVELSATQTRGVPEHLYTRGGKVSASPANVDFYTHEDCKPAQRFDPATLISNAQLIGGPPFVLWLKGKTKGKFTLKLTMEEPSDGLIRVKPPAAEPMAVVELLGVLHQHDIKALEALKVDPNTEPESDYHTALKDLVLPAQKPISDEAKVQGRRWLHAQDSLSFGRAKLLLKKLDATQWPADVADYLVVINHTGANGSVVLHGKEAEDDAKALPLKIKVADLIAAERVLWVEGANESTQLHDSRLDIGIERVDAEVSAAKRGLDKMLLPAKALVNGDWMRFTVLKIDEAQIKVEFTAKADEFPEWEASTVPKRWYVNVNRKGDPEGRRIEVSAKLTQPFEGVPLRFMLVADKDNRKAATWHFDFPNNATRKNSKGVAEDLKWKDIAQTLKHKDRKDRKDLMHWVEPTDDKGYAKQKLKLSRFGGDKFHLAVYVEQDPHLAKYIDNHADLGTRKPVIGTTLGPIQIWRKVFYQVTRPQAMPLPPMAGYDTAQRRIFLEPEMMQNVPMNAWTFAHDPSRPDWQFDAQSGDNTARLCIGDHNIGEALALFVPETKRTSPKFHLIFCDQQVDAKDGRTDTTEVVFDDTNPGLQEITFDSKRMDSDEVGIYDPPLQGGAMIISAKWQAHAYDAAKNKWVKGAKGNLAPAEVTIDPNRDAIAKAQISPPAGQLIDADHVVSVQVKLRAASGPFNGWAPNNSVAAVIKGPNATRPIAAVHKTSAHEMGHLFGQTRWKGESGMPDHPLYYQRRGGSGTHCAHGTAWVPNGGAAALDPNKDGERDAQGHGAGRYTGGDCIMYAAGLNNPVDWCEHCALDMVLTDLSKFRK